LYILASGTQTLVAVAYVGKQDHSMISGCGFPAPKMSACPTLR